MFLLSLLFNDLLTIQELVGLRRETVSTHGVYLVLEFVLVLNEFLHINIELNQIVKKVITVMRLGVG